MIKNILPKSLVLLLSLVLTVAILEVGLRSFVDITDYLEYEGLTGVGLRLKPDQKGFYIADALAGGPPVRGQFRINNTGFNSNRDYHHERDPDVLRIAVVGDSFVEALQVDTDLSFARTIENELKKRGVVSEVFGFGISGYGTAQIYQLLEKYVLDYRPDFVVYIFAPNDVEDSSPWLGRNPWMQQYDLDENGGLVALPTIPYHLPLQKQVLKRSAIFRLLYYQKHWGARWVDWKTDRTVDVLPGNEALEAEQKAWNIVEHLLVEIDQIMRHDGIPWVVVWQADADPDYRVERRLPLEDIVARHSIPYFDPTPWFESDFALHKRPLCIQGDGHWSADGHRVVGTILAQWLDDHLPKTD